MQHSKFPRVERDVYRQSEKQIPPDKTRGAGGAASARRWHL